MEIQKTLVDERIHDILRTADELRLARQVAGGGQHASLAGFRQALGRRLISAGVALMGGAGPTSLVVDHG
jgi:hypothetical protein